MTAQIKRPWGQRGGLPWVGEAVTVAAVFPHRSQAVAKARPQFNTLPRTKPARSQ